MSNYPESAGKIVDDYLQRVKAKLRGVPSNEEAEFLREIESHIYEAYQQTAGENHVERILSVLRNFRRAIRSRLRPPSGVHGPVGRQA